MSAKTPDLRVTLTIEDRVAFDTVSAELVRYFGRPPTQAETIRALAHVFNTVKVEGRLNTVLARFAPSKNAGIDVR